MHLGHTMSTSKSTVIYITSWQRWWREAWSCDKERWQNRDLRIDMPLVWRAVVAPLAGVVLKFYCNLQIKRELSAEPKLFSFFFFSFLQDIWMNEKKAQTNKQRDRERLAPPEHRRPGRCHRLGGGRQRRGQSHLCRASSRPCTREILLSGPDWW